MTFSGNIVYLRPRSVICGPSAKREGKNIPEKRHVIIIIINKQGQMISRMRVLIIQAK